MFPPVDALLYAELLLRDPTMGPLPSFHTRKPGELENLTRAEEGAKGHRAADSGHDRVHLSGMETRDTSAEQPDKGVKSVEAALGSC